MLNIEYRPFHLDKTNEVVEFVTLHPWKPLWSKDYIHQFIDHLISSYDLCFDLFIDQERIATAVLIDKVQNKGNNACLEILGLNQHYDVIQIYQSLIDTAKSKLPKMHSGIEITIHESRKEVVNLLHNNGFDIYYDLYNMHCKPKPSKTGLIDNISLLQEKDFAACYKTICLSFKDNPELAIPLYDDWLASQKSQKKQTWIYKEDNQINGFLNLFVDTEKLFGDINYVGVVPNQRKKGIGKKLLQFSLNYFSQQRIKNCHLTVASRNKNALSLYHELGFELSEHFTVFRFQI